jgi:hypothetical protein
MKNYVKRLAIIYFVALISFLMTDCVINLGDDKPSLDGDWVGLSDEVVRIRGNTGKFYDLSNTSTGSWGSAVYYNVIKEGDVKFRDLTKTDDRTWVGEQCSVAPYLSVPTSLVWSEATITLSEDGKSFEEYVVGHTYSYTWYKQ